VIRAAVTRLVVGLAGCASGAHQEPPSNTAVTESRGSGLAGSENKMTGAVSPAGDKHPGQIVYEDRVENRSWTRNAADVSQAMAWVKVHDQWKPVVRIEITGGGDTREMMSFGPGHEFLETTTAQLSGAPHGEAAPTPVPTPTPIPTSK
jgi:hypothetical protein